ncbi:MAG: flagellar biosynthesis protein FlhB [Bdellovibrionales bacterium]|nr:flagellar biosynthesis protein FlhB [Bdellovibrionales bacterium]
MAEADSGERTEDPTQQRREDFRKRGQVAQTKELASGLVILTSLAIVWLLSRFFLEQLSEVFQLSFTDFLVQSSRDGDWMPAAQFALKKSILLVAPVMAIMAVIAFVSNVAQVGFLTNEEALQVKFERIDPVSGFKRVFSLKSFVEGVKAVLKVLIVGGISYLVLRDQVEFIPKLASLTVMQLMEYIGEIVFRLFLAVGFFMAFLAGFDFLYQRYDLEQKMRMTKQEVKEENKSREGDPLVKARIRRVQREMASRRMMEAVPKADVIVTNPTHIAVAIKYSAEMVSPTIVAKGAGLVAEKIKEIAKKSNIPIVENKPLARTIFKTLKIGQNIPRELYTAVAEVLSYIYRLKKKVKY